MRVRCAVCDKPVDRWEQWRDDARAESVLVVYCHGATDRMSLFDGDAVRMDRSLMAEIRYGEGVAFTVKPAPALPQPTQP